MNSQFRDKLLTIESSDHYLRQPSPNYDAYIDGLEGILNKLSSLLGVGKFRDLLDKKLQLDTESFNEKQYIQAACELATMNEYIGRADIQFYYEKKITPPKDVDFALCYEGKNINVEVKCPSYVNKLDSSGEDVIITSLDRAPTKNDSDLINQDLQNRLAKSGVSSKVEKSMENNLWTFLTSTHEKVKDAKLQDVNVLVVCCDSALDMQAWRRYLLGFKGVFTEHSFVPHSEFDRVDYVLLTNLYNRHHRFYEADLINNHWALSSAFNLLYPNKFSKRNSTLIINGKQDYLFLSQLFNNYSEEFEDYLRDNKDIPNDNEKHEAKQILGVAWFSDKYRDKGIYHFREPKGI
ncbi:hypothetical protein [Vibrio cholerae]|uniref:hypothetical protein n=1 Tax=Vibrio cholerae TaxID=666 RepID=UPI001E475CF4|nr:hypothetical protein [Vibrio cholerae]MCD6658380.1 hypothetical protein [Vibrio cholerae]HDZ9447662.1 hypothetical protein [Vibrio cholerae]HDZ9682692.1 hypothetical protein [Vibrio cholerae]